MDCLRKPAPGCRCAAVRGGGWGEREGVAVSEDPNEPSKDKITRHVQQLPDKPHECCEPAIQSGPTQIKLETERSSGRRVLKAALVGAAIFAVAGFPFASYFGNLSPCGIPSSELVMTSTIATDGCLAFFGAAIGCREPHHHAIIALRGAEMHCAGNCVAKPVRAPRNAIYFCARTDSRQRRTLVEVGS